MSTARGRMRVQARSTMAFTLPWVLLAACASGTSPDDDPRSRLLRVPEDHALIQEAIDAASDGDTILVCAGRYSGPGNVDLSIRYKSLTLLAPSGPESTVIDCEKVVGIRGLMVADTSDVEGFTISGFTVRDATTPYRDGAAIAVRGGTARIDNCVFESCFGMDGTVALLNCDVTIDGCVFNDNYVQHAGSAIIVTQSEASISRCAFRRNRAEYGAAVFCERATVEISVCTFVGNEGLRGPGAVLVDGTNARSRARVIRSVIVNNGSGSDGGGLGVEAGGILEIVSCTVSGNWSGWRGGGIAVSGSLAIKESIVWGNCNGERGLDVYVAATGSVTVESCAYDSMRWSRGADVVTVGHSIYDDPMFCRTADCFDLEGGNYHLRPASPCLPGNNPWGLAIGALGQGCDEGVRWAKEDARSRP